MATWVTRSVLKKLQILTAVKRSSSASDVAPESIRVRLALMAPSCGSVGVLEPSMRMAVIKVIVGVMETAVMVAAVAVNKVLATSRLC